VKEVSLRHLAQTVVQRLIERELTFAHRA
jgi:hypothetical protein